MEYSINFFSYSSTSGSSTNEPCTCSDTFSSTKSTALQILLCLSDTITNRSFLQLFSSIE